MDIDRPQISSYEGAPKNTYSNVQATTMYSTHEDIFKEAFKHIPPLRDEEEEEYPPIKSSPPNFDDIKSLPGEDDGYENAGIESPNSQPYTYESSGEYADPPGPALPAFGRPRPATSKAYIAPVYDAPDPNQVTGCNVKFY